MDVLNGTESFLPELEFNGGVALGEAGVEMVLEGVGVGEVDGMLLVRVLGDIGEVKAEGFAETTEFDLALVLETELERLLGDLLEQRNPSMTP